LGPVLQSGGSLVRTQPCPPGVLLRSSVSRCASYGNADSNGVRRVASRIPPDDDQHCGSAEASSDEDREVRDRLCGCVDEFERSGKVGSYIVSVDVRLCVRVLYRMPGRADPVHGPQNGAHRCAKLRANGVLYGKMTAFGGCT